MTPLFAEPTLAEPKLAEPTLAEPTLAEPTLAEPTPMQSLDQAQESVERHVDKVVSNFDVSKLTEKPKRDLLTLAIGGVAGLVVGGFLGNLGIVNIEVLGLAVIPIAGGLAGLYLANEGYFDGAREMVGSKL